MLPTRNMRVDPEEKDFSEWLEKVGRGTNMVSPTDKNTQIDRIELMEGINVVKTAKALIESIYYDNGQMSKQADFGNRLILCPLNTDVDEYNRKILNLLPGKDQLFYSADSPYQDMDPLAINMADDDVAQLNHFNPAQLPQHKLELRIGAVVMLLRNVNVQKGLCNGTRLVVTHLGPNIIRCRIITESSRCFGQEINLTRFKFEYDGRREGRDDDRQFYRTQFPIRLAFAETINKAQGATADRVGLALRTEVFGAGQTYVALSRARNAASITVYAPNSPIENERVRIRNVVATGLFFE